jgi:hypothetical protein
LIDGLLETTAELKVVLPRPLAAVRIVYCFLTVPEPKIALTVAPPSVAAPVTLARLDVAEETCII